MNNFTKSHYIGGEMNTSLVLEKIAEEAFEDEMEKVSAISPELKKYMLRGAAGTGIMFGASAGLLGGSGKRVMLDTTTGSVIGAGLGAGTYGIKKAIGALAKKKAVEPKTTLEKLKAHFAK
jgi:hypothetical protein